MSMYNTIKKISQEVYTHDRRKNNTAENIHP